MRAWVRAVVTAVFVPLYLASSIVLAFGSCCHPEGETGDAKMECCKKGGKHICPLMSKRRSTTESRCSVKAPCAAGHDSGVPSGLGAPPLESVKAPLPPFDPIHAAHPSSPPHSRDLRPPSPPPKA